MSEMTPARRLFGWSRRLGRASLAAFALGILAVAGVRAEPEDVTPIRIRAAVERALPRLQKSLVVYAEKRDCFSCHHQAVSLVAMEIARSRGLAIDEDALQGAVALTLADLESALEPYRKGRGQPGGVTRADLCALDARSRRPSRRRDHRRGDGIPAEGRSRSGSLDDVVPPPADRGQPLHHDGPGASGARDTTGPKARPTP